ncbi:MAG: hypothetical protein AAFZ65_15480 [Planctomycetota bacterium]
MRTLSTLAASTFAILSTPALVQAQSLFGIDERGDFFRYRVAERSRELIGSTGIVAPTGLDVGPDGRVYSISAGDPALLFRIDIATGKPTVVGNLFSTPNFVFEGGLAIAPDGRAWGVNLGSANDPALFEVDLESGKAMAVATISGPPRDLNGLAWRPDDKLVAMDRISNELLAIDPKSGALETIAPLQVDLSETGGILTLGGFGYFVTTVDGVEQLWRFDPFTGQQAFMTDLFSDRGGFPLYGISVANPLISSPRPGVAGMRNRIEINGSSPGATVGIAVSRGFGTLPISTACGTEAFDLLGIAALATGVANWEGKVEFFVKPHPGLSGSTLWFQAVEAEGCSVGNVVSVTFQ